jgi:hypothetical protein
VGEQEGLMANPVKITLTVKGRSFKKTEEAFNKAVARSIKDIGKNFAQNAIKNASIDLTPLRKSIKSTVIITPTRATAVITASVDYAHKVHEQHAPGTAMPRFGPGRRTASQPPTPEGGAGGLFFKRVSDFRGGSYLLHSREVISAALEQRRATTKLT